MPCPHGQLGEITIQNECEFPKQCPKNMMRSRIISAGQIWVCNRIMKEANDECLSHNEWILGRMVGVGLLGLF